MKSDDEVIDRLLSGKNRMSRATKDAIFDQVANSVVPSKRPNMLYGVAGALVLASAAILLIPMVLSGTPGKATEVEFGTRGKSSATGALSLNCSTGEGHICERDAKLLFDLQGTTGYTHFAALARHSSGTIIWYFPDSAEGKSLEISKHLEKGVLVRGVVLGATHEAGDYQVFGLYSQRSLTREEIKSNLDIEALTLGPDTAVVRREFSLR